MMKIRICLYRYGLIMAIDNQERNPLKNKLLTMPLTRQHMLRFLMELLKIPLNRKSTVQHMALDKMTNQSICISKDRVLSMDRRWSLETLEYNPDSKELQGSLNLMRFAMIKFT